MASKNGFPSRQKPSPTLGAAPKSGAPGHVTGHKLTGSFATSPRVVAKDPGDQPVPTPTRW